eukprot:5252006-Prorocentrum_lima.AAC.1
MTSSLVGSEMCIRDSYSIQLMQTLGQSVHRVRPHFNQQVRQLKEREPVSYTHLTLPTICSV